MTDYSSPDAWIAAGGNGEHKVDVFHLIPTSWIGEKGGPLICPVEDPAYRAQAEFNVPYQAGVFEGMCNIYAPHYRQLEPYYCLELSPESRLRDEHKEPWEDVLAATEYYFEHYNKGRPFILSAHSQGALLSLFILSEYFKNHPEIYERMIAAYILGYSVTDKFMAENPHLKFAEGASDTGVIISYNTEAPHPAAESGLILPGALCINPITWSRGYETAPRELSRGSIIKGRVLPQYADAAIEPGTGRLVCSTAEPRRLYSTIFPEGIYHVHDFGLYFYDLRENIRLRIDKYFEKIQVCQ